MRGNWLSLLVMAGMVGAGVDVSFAGLPSSAPPVEQRQSGRSIQDAQLSADGKWLVYALMPDYGSRPVAGSADDSAEVVARSVSGAVERRYPAGKASGGGGGVQLSADGRWAAFHRVTDDGSQVVLVALDTGAERSFAAQSFKFSSPATPAESELSAEARPGWLALSFSSDQSVNAQPAALTLHPLSGGEALHFEAVHAFAFDPAGTSLAFSDQRGLSVQRLIANDEARVIVPTDVGAFSELTWSEDGSALAAVHTRDDRTSVYAITPLQSAVPAVVHVELQPAAGTATGPLRWRDALDGVYFQMRQSPRAHDRSGSESEDAAPQSLSIWHWQKQRLPMEQRMRDAQPVLYWHYLSLSRAASVQLSDETLTLVAPQGRGDHVLAYDVSPYGWMNRGDSQLQQRDYYLIELDNGQRRLLSRDVQTPGSSLLVIEPQLTPDGQQWLYWQRGDYLLQDVLGGRPRNLTGSLPVKFSLPENDPQKGWFPDDGGIMAAGLPLLQGWSNDGEYVLVSNHWDIWALPLRGRAAINLTGDGASTDRIYRRADLSTGRGAAGGEVDLTQPMYLTVFDRVRGENGLARWVPGKGTSMLHQEPAELSYVRAARAPVWMVLKSTAITPNDWYAVKDFKPSEALTDANPQARSRAIGGVRYLRYRTSRGDQRHALLQLPVGYEEGQRYPLVVLIYKGQSAMPHRLVSRTTIGHFWSSRGYAVLLPDIVPRMNESGAAALESVLAGVDAAIESGVADAQRLGLYGHSYGAYQTLYIISQSDRFTVAAASAGPTNAWSWCTETYGNTYPGMLICESNQLYFSGPWWAQWQAYLENSPLYHARSINTPLLLGHGDQDTAVSFDHSVMLFNTLRRLRKPVVLLAYEGEGHGLEGVSDDFRARHLALFDHYLKLGPIPAWWRAE